MIPNFSKRIIFSQLSPTNNILPGKGRHMFSNNNKRSNNNMHSNNNKRSIATSNSSKMEE